MKKTFSELNIIRWEELRLCNYREDNRAFILHWKLPKYIGDWGSFRIEIEKDNFNRIHFPYGIPFELRGFKLGYKVYKATIKKMGYISTNIEANPSIKKLWSYLLQDPDFFSLQANGRILLVDNGLNKHDIKELIYDFFNHINF